MWIVYLIYPMTKPMQIAVNYFKLIPKRILGNLSTGVSEPRTATKREAFSLLARLDAITFVNLQSVFTLIETLQNHCPWMRTAHFRLPSVVQKLLCLSSLLLCHNSQSTLCNYLAVSPLPSVHQPTHTPQFTIWTVNFIMMKFSLKTVTILKVDCTLKRKE